MALVISRSLWKKLLATLVAVVSFVLLHEAGTIDSLSVPRADTAPPPPPVADGTRHLFTATAYCKGTTTASGVGVRTGIAASDAAILPVGSVVNITTAEATHNGVYTIMDTGPKVQGRHVDIYMWSCHEALAFGRQKIELSVLRLGWNPGNSIPSLVDRLFRRREADRRAAPPPPPVTEPLPSDDGAGGETDDTEAANAGTSTIASTASAGAALDATVRPATSSSSSLTTYTH